MRVKPFLVITLAKKQTTLWKRNNQIKESDDADDHGVMCARGGPFELKSRLANCQSSKQ
jgi:hypothetical protein